MRKRPKQKKSLAKGFDAVLNNSSNKRATDIFFGDVSSDTARFAELPIATITPNRNQPRTNFDDNAMQELVHSFKTVGQLQPIVVRSTDKDKYELIMGERRLRAARLAGKDTIATIIRETDDENMLRDALLENLHRAQLDPIEEAAAYNQMLNDFGITQQELATQIGRSRPQIANMIRLLNLPAEVQKLVQEGEISIGHSRALAVIKDKETVIELAKTAIAKNWSVRQLEEQIAKLHSKPKTQVQKHKELSKKLSDKYHLPVTVTQRGEKGSVTFKFKSQTELNELLENL
ncbi:MAG: ParB/RepB/Spo0J family partition protein [Micrococcaceae bacterium]